MIFGHDEGKNIKQLCNGVIDAICVAMGGTGKKTHTSNAILIGNGTNALGNVATAKGAFYAEAANGAPKFGTLPIAQGGTGGATKEEALVNLLGYVPSLIKLVKTDDTTNYGTNYTSFAPIFGTITEENYMGNLSYVSKTLGTFGDRSDYSVKGVQVGKNINKVRVSFGVRFLNNEATSTALQTYIIRYRNGSGTVLYTAANAIGNGRLSQNGSTIFEVQEGDFIYLRSYKGVATKDIDVIADTYATQLCVEAIG